jgi:glyoxylase-like metal-dependent hydrolase (beta-lactamase superfamily II)
MEICLKRLSESIYLRNAIDNLGWIDLGDQVVVIDALEDAELGDEVLALIRSTTINPITTVINTHRHSDHMALNSFFEAQGARVISFHDLDDAESQIIRGCNGLSVQLIPLAKTHSNKDLLVFVPEESILFCGDVFGWGLVPWEGRLRQEIYDNICQTYDLMISLNPKIVVPGHGPVCSVNELRIWLDYFKRLVRIQLVEPAELATVPPPKQMVDWWRFVEWKHQFSLDKVKTLKFSESE